MSTERRPPRERRRATRLVLALGSALFALSLAAAGALYLATRTPPPTVHLADGEAARKALFADRPAPDPVLNPAPNRSKPPTSARGQSTPPADLWAEGPRDFLALQPDLSIQERDLFFPGVAAPGMQQTRWGYAARRPDQRIPFVFPDHPKGGFHVVTNGLGLRRDGPVPEAPKGPVLVLGDSHVDGVLDNPENLCALLEARLIADSAPALVLNGAVGGTTFANQLGALERFSQLEPRLVVWFVYSGNDFFEQVLLERYLRGHPEPESPRNALRRVLDQRGPGGEQRRGWVSQELQQALYFAANPEDEVLVVEAATEVLWRARVWLEERGARLLVVHLPPATRVAEGAYGELLGEALAAAQAGPEVLDAAPRLWRALSHNLARLTIPAVDLAAPLSELGAKAFWPSDLHLSAAGHQRAALALYEPIRALLARP